MGRPLFPEFRSDRFDPEKRELLFKIGKVGLGVLTASAVVGTTGFLIKNSMRARQRVENHLTSVGKALFETYRERSLKSLPRTHDHYHKAVAENAFDGRVSVKDLTAFEPLAKELGIHPHRVLYAVVSDEVSAALNDRKNPVAALKEASSNTQNENVRKIYAALIKDKLLRARGLKLAKVKGAADRLDIIGKSRFDWRSGATY